MASQRRGTEPRDEAMVPRSERVADVFVFLSFHAPFLSRSLPLLVRSAQITAHVAALDLHVRRADPTFFDDPSNTPADTTPAPQTTHGRSSRSRATSPQTGTPRKGHQEEAGEGEGEEARTLYCLCGRESYGEMVACDNSEVGCEGASGSLESSY